MANSFAQKWFVYIIQTDTGSLYTGITNDIDRRFTEHQSSSKGANFFHFSKPCKILYREEHPNRSSASKREAAIKKLSRQEKLELVRNQQKTIYLPEVDADLAKECRCTAFLASGSGGQHVNVTSSAVRLTHIPSGLVVTSQKERSQYLNKKECLKKLREKAEKINYRKPTRIATKMSATVKAKDRASKIKDSQKKQLRRPLGGGEPLD